MMEIAETNSGWPARGLTRVLMESPEVSTASMSPPKRAKQNRMTILIKVNDQYSALDALPLKVKYLEKQ